jgi:nickel-dependent lactate racemase
MGTSTLENLIAAGSASADLSISEIRAAVKSALAGISPGERVLAIVPDKTRDDNTDLLIPFASEELLARGAACFDILVALGTHSPMTEAEKRVKLGLDNGAEIPLLGRVFDHRWDDPNDLVSLGTLPGAQVSDLTGGLLNSDIPVRLNRLLAPGLYDTVLVFGATVPHEVAGFSGGSKYFFQGVAGPDLTHQTHWLGALATIEKIIGRVETPTRRLIEAAADLVPARIVSFNSVVTREDGRLRTHALFAGDIKAAFRRAAEISSQVHIKYVDRKYKRVVALLDEHYTEMWVGGKASYKLGGIIEEVGELIIYAPHLDRISDTHGRLIEKYGYWPLEKVKQLLSSNSDLEQNLCVAAHLAHVSFSNSGLSREPSAPRYRITLSSGLDEANCRRVNLGFLNPADFRVEDYESLPDTLIVPQAGRDLYLFASEHDR